MAEVFEVLAQDHAEVRQMLAELEAGKTASSGASSNDLSMRKKMMEHLVIEESKHEALEEMYFWPAVREKLPGGDTLADTAIGQEQEGKEVLDELDKLDAGDAGFEKLVTKFIQVARTHISYEETRVWPPLRNVLSAGEASEIGTKIEQGKKTGPTRPHPHTPPSPGVLKATGPAAAAADRARDKATGRGQ
ncbi:MAG TPA: hemerythrin domain-containing protein [Streptosporangiaceae bacterium]|jgi:hemerythrin-like domain-containing protein|nr:hemerythrin domain-containing protein [Streptosporangiaceae bacterium]